MKPHLAALLDQVSLIGQELSPTAVDHLADRADRLSSSSEASDLTASAATPPELALLERLASLWRQVPNVTPASLGLALRAASRTGVDVAAKQVIELVWTGPQAEAVTLRRNDQALLEVISSAERELLLVSYAVYHVPAVASALSKAKGRGVGIRLVLEFEGSVEGDQTYDPMKALGKLPPGVEVFEWPLDQRHSLGAGSRRGYVHAKCAVADRRIAFVSSANLTSYAMEANIELGVLVRGGSVPERIAVQFDQLIRKGILKQR